MPETRQQQQRSFGELVAGRLREAHMGAGWRFDPAGFSVRNDRRETLNLSRAFPNWVDQGRPHTPLALDRFIVAEFRVEMPAEPPPVWDVVQGSIRLLVMNRAAFQAEEPREYDKDCHLEDADRIAHALVSEHLVLVLQFPVGGDWVPVRNGALEGWGKTFAEALELALRNAAAAPELTATEFGFIVKMERCATLLFQTDLLLELGVKPGLGMVIPFTSGEAAVIVSGQDADLEKAASFAIDAIKGGKAEPLCLAPLIFEEGGWRTYRRAFTGAAGDLLRHQALHDAHIQHEACWERLGRPTVELKPIGTSQGLRTFVRLHEQDTLTPLADYIMLDWFGSDPFVRSWGDVEPIIGPFQRDHEEWPPAFTIPDFLPAEETESLRVHGAHPLGAPPMTDPGWDLFIPYKPPTEASGTRPTWDNARPRIRPHLAGPSKFAPSGAATAPLAGAYELWFTLDQRDWKTWTIGTADLDAWGVGIAAVLEAGLARLAQDKPLIRTHPSGVKFVIWGDRNTPEHIPLIPSLIASGALHVRGDPVVAPTTVGRFLLAGSEEPEALDDLARRIPREAHRGRDWIGSAALIFRDGRWSTYQFTGTGGV